MRITHLIPLAALALTATVAGAQDTMAHKHREKAKVETQAELQKEAKVGMAEARAIALKEVPNSTIQSGGLEREGGKLIYSFDMKVAGKSGIDEVNIDAMTGKLISNKHETPKQEKAEEKADAAAKTKKP